MGNTFKTAFLLTGLTLLLMFIGSYFGGQRGMLTALIIAGVMNFVSYFYSDKIALATYGAQAVTREQLPRVYQVVERLTQKAIFIDRSDVPGVVPAITQHFRGFFRSVQVPQHHVRPTNQKKTGLTHAQRLLRLEDCAETMCF